MTQRSIGEQIFAVFNGAVMIGLAFATLYPFLYVTLASFSDAGLLLKHRGLLLRTLGFETGSYKMVFSNPVLLSSYMNTIIYVSFGTCLSVSLSWSSLSTWCRYARGLTSIQRRAVAWTAGICA